MTEQSSVSLAAPPSGGPATPVRDPRVDPRGEDVLRKGRRIRIVLGRPQLRGPWVTFQTPTDIRRGFVSAERLDAFQDWAKDAEVAETSEQGPAHAPDGAGASNDSESI
jgi:hypothetical protein